MERRGSDDGATTDSAVEASHECRTHEESEQQFRVLFESSLDGIVLVSLTSCRVRLANATFCRMLGYSTEELRALTLDAINPNEQVPEVLDAIRRHADDEISQSSGLAVKRKDGSTFSADVHSVPVTLSGQRCMLVTFRDAAERQRLQSRLVQADRLANMGLLAAGVTHEINNPLTYVLHNLACLAEGLGQPEPPRRDDQRRLVAGALDGAQKIHAIVNNMKTFGHADEARGPVPLNRVIESVVNLAHSEIKHRARLVKEYGEDLVVEGGEGRLAQVFLNLLINAAQALDERDFERNQIRIKTWQEADLVIAEISDTGCGIPAERLAQVFAPFFTTKPRGLGSGLGLSISRDIVESHGGTIELSSGPGGGTRVIVKLPAVAQDRAKATPQRAHEGDVGGKISGRILVVDDEPLVVEMIRLMLEREHTVCTAGSGREARRLLEAGEAFDLILCDLLMSNGSGMELYAWLEEHLPAYTNKVAFMTGGAFTPLTRRFLDRVNALRLEKPFVRSTLRAVIRRGLRAGE